MVKGSADMSDSDDRPWRSEIPRRDFVKLAGYSTAAVSLGAQLGLPAWAQALTPPPAGVGAGWDTMSDTWVATDGLDRTLPTYDQVGPPRANRFVGLFYFLWLGAHGTNGPYDISKILAANPDAIHNTNDSAWGPLGKFHHWGEPHFGYYLSDDAWVIRKHATMLTDAGVDVIIFDTTNGYTYQDTYRLLLDTFADIRAQGENTPQIAFLTPFGTPRQVVVDLYQNLYQPGIHPELWFHWEGKPLILADPALLTPAMLIGQGSDPSPLDSGHAQGQTFTATAPLMGVGAQVPTWATSTSAMTLSLYRDGPGGALVARQRSDNVVDNSVVELTLGAPAPAGRYYLEQSDPSGPIGWWTNTSDVYGGGSAYLDGQPVTGDRALAVDYASDPWRQVLDFFTFRKPQPDYFIGPTQPDEWGWLEVAPQHVFRDDQGRAEQMTVSVAQNAVDGRLGAMTEPHARGRSFHDNTLPTGTALTPWGLNLQEQWDRALAADPEFIFVTGWNEWVAQRYTSFNGISAPVVFVDEFDWEHSRDIEPMTGGHDDAYYYQLVANIRRYKGARPTPRASAPKTIPINGRFAQWADVGPDFRDHIGDTAHRNHPGWGSTGTYVNTTGRNDIILAKATRDSENLYFYVRTRQPITPFTDPNWMLLFLNVDGDPATGWKGYDFVVNRNVMNRHRTALETSTGGWNWRIQQDLRYAVQGCEMELAIPRRALGLDPGQPLRIDFKWSDNMQEPDNILDFISNGDVAPSGRFNFRYQE